MDTDIVSKIEKTIKTYREDHSILFEYGGFGYCAYVTAILFEKLKKQGIKSTVLLGQEFQETKEASNARVFLEALVLSLPDDDSDYGIIKKAFIKRGNRLPKITGHTALLIGEAVFDATSSQFNLPQIYPLSFFNKIWKVTYDAKIVTGNPDVDFGVVRISRVKRKEVVLENIAGVPRSPIWGKW